MTHQTKICSQAKAEIEALRAQGVTLSDEHIVAINALAWEIEKPAKRITLAKGKPIKCGNVWLWPLTIHASNWLFDEEREHADQEKAMAYAMAHRDDDLMTVGNEQVSAWFNGLLCTIEELRIAMSAIIEQMRGNEPTVKAENAVTAEELAQIMVANVGGSFEMWERQCSIPYIFNFLDTTSKQDEAEKRKSHVERSTVVLARYTDKLLRSCKDG